MRLTLAVLKATKYGLYVCTELVSTTYYDECTKKKYYCVFECYMYTLVKYELGGGLHVLSGALHHSIIKEGVHCIIISLTCKTVKFLSKKLHYSIMYDDISAHQAREQ